MTDTIFPEIKIIEKYDTKKQADKISACMIELNEALAKLFQKHNKKMIKYRSAIRKMKEAAKEIKSYLPRSTYEHIEADMEILQEEYESDQKQLIKEISVKHIFRPEYIENILKCRA